MKMSAGDLCLILFITPNKQFYFFRCFSNNFFSDSRNREQKGNVKLCVLVH